MLRLAVHPSHFVKQVTSGILMLKGWLCVPAIYSKCKYLHSRLAVSVIVRGSLLGRLAYKFAVALISANLYP